MAIFSCSACSPVVRGLAYALAGLLSAWFALAGSLGAPSPCFPCHPTLRAPVFSPWFPSRADSHARRAPQTPFWTFVAPRDVVLVGPSRAACRHPLLASTSATMASSSASVMLNALRVTPMFDGTPARWSAFRTEFRGFTASHQPPVFAYLFGTPLTAAARPGDSQSPSIVPPLVTSTPGGGRHLHFPETSPSTSDPAASTAPRPARPTSPVAPSTPSSDLVDQQAWSMLLAAFHDIPHDDDIWVYISDAETVGIQKALHLWRLLEDFYSPHDELAVMHGLIDLYNMAQRSDEDFLAWTHRVVRANTKLQAIGGALSGPHLKPFIISRSLPGAISSSVLHSALYTSDARSKSVLGFATIVKQLSKITAAQGSALSGAEVVPAAYAAHAAASGASANTKKKKKCRNCLCEDHTTDKCPHKSTKCPDCKWHRGDHRDGCKAKLAAPPVGGGGQPGAFVAVAPPALPGAAPQPPAPVGIGAPPAAHYTQLAASSASGSGLVVDDFDIDPRALAADPRWGPRAYAVDIGKVCDFVIADTYYSSLPGAQRPPTKLSTQLIYDAFNVQSPLQPTFLSPTARALVRPACQPAEFFYDSACNTHLTPFKSDFSTYTPVKGAWVRVGGGTLPIAGVGDVHASYRDALSGEFRGIILRGVIHVPSFGSVRLLGSKRLLRSGARVSPTFDYVDLAPSSAVTGRLALRDVPAGFGADLYIHRSPTAPSPTPSSSAALGAPVAATGARSSLAPSAPPSSSGSLPSAVLAREAAAAAYFIAAKTSEIASSGSPAPCAPSTPSLAPAPRPPSPSVAPTSASSGLGRPSAVASSSSATPTQSTRPRAPATGQVSISRLARSDALALFHKRLCHLHEQNLQRHLSGGIASGLPGSLSGSLPACSACRLAKSTHCPAATTRSTDLLTPAVGIFQRVHADIWGPVPPSIDGEQYCFGLTDEFSGLRWIAFLRKKNDAPVAFRRFFDTMIVGNGLRLRSFHGDQDRVFVGSDLTALLQRLQVDYTYSSSYTPIENHVAERSWRVLADNAKALLLDSGLPDAFWSHAFRTTVYVWNRLTPAGSSQSPYAYFYGSHPDLAHLRVWGCPCWVHIPDPLRRKFQAKAREGIFIGYAQRSREYYIWVPDRSAGLLSGTIIKSRHCIFDEWWTEPSVLATSTAPAPPPSSSLPATPAPHLDPVQATPTTLVDSPEPRHIDLAAPATASEESPVPPHRGSEEPRTPLHPLRSEEPAVNAPLQPLVQRPVRAASAPPARRRLLLDAVSSSPSDSLLPRRQSTRASRAPQRLISSPTAYAVQAPEPEEPASLAAAMRSSSWPQWRAAMEKELAGIEQRGTFEHAVLPPGATLVSAKWVYRLKRAADASISEHKARLVARGFEQRAGRDYGLLYAPCSQYSSWRLFIALAAGNGWEIYQLDVVGAFLWATLKEEIYLRPPDYYFDLRPAAPRHSVLRLHKSLYGLKQAPHEWHRTIKAWLQQQGFRSSHQDECLFLRYDKGQLAAVICLHVDDAAVAVTTGDTAWYEQFKRDMNSEFQIKDLGSLNWYLSMAVTRHDNGAIHISMPKYTEEVLERYGMQDCNPTRTPLRPGFKFLKGETTSQPLDKQGLDLYKSIVGSIAHLANTVRPDICHAARAAARVLLQPTEEHLGAVKHVLRYLRGTSDQGITFNGPDRADNIITALCDSAWADADKGRSTGGHVLMLNGGPIHWTSGLQQIVADSTAAAEYIQMHAASTDIMTHREIMQQLGFPQTSGTHLFCDNDTAAGLARGENTPKATRHLSVKYHSVKERSEDGIISIKNIPSRCNISDIFTKSLPLPQFVALAQVLLGHPLGGATDQDFLRSAATGVLPRVG